MARKYLVTGGTGFLGAALVRRLLREGHSVRVLDNNSRGRPRRLEGVDVETFTADIRDATAVDRAVAGVDSVVHMAYVNGTRFFYEFPELVLDVGIAAPSTYSTLVGPTACVSSSSRLRPRRTRYPQSSPRPRMSPSSFPT